MSPGDVISVCPADIRFKLSRDLDLGGIQGGDWDFTRRVLFERTEKYRSIVQRFVDGRPWIETDMFRYSYPDRFKKGDRVRTAANLQHLAEIYAERVDRMYESLKTVGFQCEFGGVPVPLPKIHIGRDGEIMLGNQGNHRLAIAKLISLSEIKARVNTVHAAYRA